MSEFCACRIGCCTHN